MPKLFWKANYRILWHSIMNHQDILIWHWEHLVFGVFIIMNWGSAAPQTFQRFPHLGFSSWIGPSLRLTKGDAWSAFSGLSLKLFLVFWKHTYTVTYMHIHIQETNPTMYAACLHTLYLSKITNIRLKSLISQLLSFKMKSKMQRIENKSLYESYDL